MKFKKLFFLLKVKNLCKKYGNSNVAFVSTPEVLLGAMAQATIREISIAARARQNISTS